MYGDNGLTNCAAPTSLKIPYDKISPDERCAVCGGILILPHLAVGFIVPAEADYMCLK
jgi:hypothetical protein